MAVRTTLAMVALVVVLDSLVAQRVLELLVKVMMVAP